MSHLTKKPLKCFIYLLQNGKCCLAGRLEIQKPAEMTGRSSQSYKYLPIFGSTSKDHVMIYMYKYFGDSNNLLSAYMNVS